MIQFAKYIHDHMDEIRAFNSLMNIINALMIGLWIYLFYRSRKLRKDWIELAAKINIMKPELSNWGNEIKRSNDLFEKHGATRVYLVWLVGQDVSTSSPINALIGCFRDPLVAEKYAGNKEHYVQEIEVA